MVMIEQIHQGDILNVEKIKHPVVVVSRDFFNASGEIIGCPIIENSVEGPLHIFISAKYTSGYVQCEKLAMLDLTVRGYKKVDTVAIASLINMADAIQGIFEYL